MYEVIEPKIEVVGFGPIRELPNGELITPDEFVYGASGITYKGMRALDELVKAREEDKDVREKMIKSLIKSAGSGHASMATTPGLWCILQGNSSKLVDSIFTGARFSSSLMPSGRRVPIAKENILIPKGIAKKGEKAVDIYVKASEHNIEVYEELQKRGVPTQEASKIVQYGHFGGGFMFMPLETLISNSVVFENLGDLIPLEGHDIVFQLEKFVHENGMEVVYEARKAAPREGCPNPNIFHNRWNFASSQRDDNDKTRIISAIDIDYPGKSEKIKQYLKMRNKSFSNPLNLEDSWKEALRELQEIVEDSNNSVQVTTFVNTPWRVWGEVKRHRTLPQTAESIYLAVERALLDSSDDIGHYSSLPKSVGDNSGNLQMWEEAFNMSLDAYERLVEMGIKKSDAIAVIPRGLKLGVVKTFDLYNLTTGYMSLRLCNTAEPEMRAITEEERSLIRGDSRISSDVKSLLAPKCHYTGFCHEPDYKKCCGKVRQVVEWYNEEFHNKITAKREQEIRSAIETIF